jgi:hypothetical protein
MLHPYEQSAGSILEMPMILATRIKVILAENPAKSLAGVRIALYDRDEGDPDDYLAEGITGNDGIVSLKYDSRAFMDAEDKDAWRIDSLPDLYVLVLDVDGRVLLSTRDQVQMNTLPRMLEVSVAKELAEQQGWLE